MIDRLMRRVATEWPGNVYRAEVSDVTQDWFIRVTRGSAGVGVIDRVADDII
jgi:hypothetical protein